MKQCLLTDRSRLLLPCIIDERVLHNFKAVMRWNIKWNLPVVWISMNYYHTVYLQVWGVLKLQFLIKNLFGWSENPQHEVAKQS